MDLTINFESLDIFLKKKNLSFPLKLLILVNILQALRILKPQGIVHMDLSLSNILINDSFSIKLIDFG